MRLVSVELEIRREPAAERAKAPQELVTSRLARNAELPSIGNKDFDVITFIELKRFHHGRGKTYRETVAPFGDLHTGTPMDILMEYVYLLLCRSSGRCADRSVS
jgi:hypothetical protein